MAEFTPIRTTSSKLSSVAIKEGQLIFCTDAKAIYLDIDNSTRIQYLTKEPVKIVSFATGTDSEIAAMIQAHYTGEININDHWKVGDTRIISLAATPAVTNTNVAHAAQNMKMTIIGFNHETLANAEGKRTYAAVTLQCQDALGNNGTAEEDYMMGKSTTLSYYDNWEDSAIRKYINNTFIPSLPAIYQTLVKEVKKKTLADRYSSLSTTTTIDKGFLLSVPEVYGSNFYNNGVYKGSSSYEESQYSYYTTQSNRMKYANKNGGDSSNSWIDSSNWGLRSPGRSTVSGGDNFFMTVNIYDLSTPSFLDGKGTIGVAPAFAL